MSEKIQQFEKLIEHILYGDIEEMPLDILGNNCPDFNEYQSMDKEQRTRLAAAATIKAFFDNRLNLNGGLNHNNSSFDNENEMKTFTYSLGFSPYLNTIKAKNKKDALAKIKKLWPCYDIDNVVTLY